jgi:putative flavoprotein involved in K+ transport
MDGCRSTGAREDDGGDAVSTQQFEVVIVGGGQAGLVMSYWLTQQGRQHVVLEQDRLVESWRTRRWDSLRKIAPNWTLHLPGAAYVGDDPDGFMSKDEVVAFLETYARSFAAPVREGIHVSAVNLTEDGSGFRVWTSTSESYHAPHVVLATGALQQPRLPACAAALPSSVTQIPALAYRNPAALPPGAILVVGSGESGCQIADELSRAGRAVYLAMGRGWWAPRRYRGRDAAAWLRAIGHFDRTVDDLPPGVRTGPPNPALTGMDGGRDLSVHTLVAQGVVPVGRLDTVQGGTVTFAADLSENLAWGDQQAMAFLNAVDAHIRDDGLDATPQEHPVVPQSPEELARRAPAVLTVADVGTVIWATGYRPDFGWIKLPFLDDQGYPVQQRGVTAVPGLYVLGLDWLYSARSGLFAGIGADAAYLASVITGEPVA